jgi:acyl carrier protein
MKRDEILSEIRTSLHEMFELEPEAIIESARLREDLDLDSIDAIDLAVKLKDLLGRRVELSLLKELRTIADVLDLIENEMRKSGEKLGSTGVSENSENN